MFRSKITLADLTNCLLYLLAFYATLGFLMAFFPDIYFLHPGENSDGNLGAAVVLMISPFVAALTFVALLRTGARNLKTKRPLAFIIGGMLGELIPTAVGYLLYGFVCAVVNIIFLFHSPNS